MIDVPDIQRQRTELGRVIAIGRRTDSGERCSLLVIHELNGAWTFHGLGAPGVKISQTDTVALVEAILELSR
ncbi:MAG: hypothetical protein M3332_03455 [Actinomycetota bacterium]|nr:hypothetical protein [Actinomycetota bacterium]